MLILIHWPRFGSYHLSRLQAAHDLLAIKGSCAYGLEIASCDNTYLWRRETGCDRYRFLVFPEFAYEDIPRSKMWTTVGKKLNDIRPDAVAVNGYSTVDSLSVLAWCKRHHKKAVLMTDSKSDDRSRNSIIELIKRVIVQQYDAALCAGTPHRLYLESLGMDNSRIFDGYDVVDNDFFTEQSHIARSNPNVYRSMPGLGSTVPFFLCSARLIKRKNIDGIIQAYERYRIYCNERRLNQPWNLLILGDGPERIFLEQTVLAKRIVGVTFAGFRQIDELPIYYGLASAFIHAAHIEQWGLVVNEAMACGLPLIVSRSCGCVTDLIADGKNGFLFDSHNTDELAELMFKMSSGVVDIIAMGKYSRECIALWGPGRFAQGLIDAIFLNVSS